MATLKYLSQYFSTTLNVGGGIDDTQTTGIVLQSVSGVTITNPGQICITYSDPLDTSVAEWIDYTSINGSNELVGVTRGREGFSAKSHLQNATVAFVFSASHHNDVVDEILDIEDASTNSFGIYNSSLSRQAIINGNFDVWQRGTSVALADVTSTFQADRWRDYIDKNGGTLPTLTRLRVSMTTGQLPGSFYSSRLTINGAGTSLGASSYHQYQQIIEHGTRLLCGAGKKVTVSFWAASDIANKKIGVSLTQNYGTGGSPSADDIPTGAASFTLTNTLTKYTVTFTTTTLSGKTFGTANDDGLKLIFWNMWGSNLATYVGTTGAETYVGAGDIYLAAVQLCAGDVALPFQPKSFEDELRACQRYLIDLTGGSANANIVIAPMTGITTTIANGSVQLPVDMRIPPSLLSFTASDLSLGYPGMIAVTGVSIAVASNRMVTIAATVAAGLTAGLSWSLYRPGTTTRILLAAEL